MGNISGNGAPAIRRCCRYRRSPRAADGTPSERNRNKGGRMGRLVGLLGLLTMTALAYAFSTNRRAIRLKTVAWGLGLQFTFAIIVLKWAWGQRVLRVAADGVNRLLGFSFAG